MVMILGFLISFAAGWSVVAADALYRAEQRPGIFRGTPGMILLLTISAVGGLTIAYAVIWFLQSMISAAVTVILAGGLVLGGAASKKLHVNAAGDANRMMVGFAVLVVLYGLVWTYFPPPPLAPPAPPDDPGDVPHQNSRKAAIGGLPAAFLVFARAVVGVRAASPTPPPQEFNPLDLKGNAACKFSSVTTTSTRPSRRSRKRCSARASSAR